MDAAADHSPWWYLPVANAALQELLCSKETSINFVCFKKATSALFFSFLFFLSFLFDLFRQERECVVFLICQYDFATKLRVAAKERKEQMCGVF